MITRRPTNLLLLVSKYSLHFIIPQKEVTLLVLTSVSYIRFFPLNSVHSYFK